MDSTKLSATFLLTILLSTLPTSLSCNTCPGTSKPKPKHPHPHPPKTGPGSKPPSTGPIVLPPIIGGSPVPIIGGSPVPIIGKPPVIGPIIGGGSPPSTVPCLPTPTTPVAPAPPASCPIDSLKLGACVDLLGGLVHIGLGDPVVNQCCPVIQGLVELEAAVCLCTTIKLKLLNINIYLPLALQLLLTCGKAPPPGYTCTI